MAVFRNMPDAEYRALYRDHLSVSGWKRWRECPAAQFAKISKTWEEPPREPAKDPLLIGQFAHCALLQPELLTDFYFQHPEILLKSGANKGQPGEAYQVALRIVNKLSAQPGFPELFAGESELTLTGEIAGVPWCGRLDRTDTERRIFFDFKTAADFGDHWETVDGKNLKMPWYSGYWWQIAVYQELLQQNYPDGDPWVGFILGGTKQDPPAIGLWAMEDGEKLATALTEVINSQDEIISWRDGKIPAPPCGDIVGCPYCRENSGLQLRKAI